MVSVDLIEHFPILTFKRKLKLLTLKILLIERDKPLFLEILSILQNKENCVLLV